MCFLNCQCKCGCTVAALILSALLGIIAAFLQITAVITVAPVFLFAVLAIALVYLGVLVLAAPGRRGDGCECLCGILTALLAVVFGCKNSASRLEQYKPTHKTAITAAALFAVGLLCLSRESVFIYFNF